MFQSKFISSDYNILRYAVDECYRVKTQGKGYKPQGNGRQPNVNQVSSSSMSEESRGE